MVDPPQQLQANSSSLKWGDVPKQWCTKNDQSTGSSWGFPFWETSNMWAPHSCIVLHAFEHILASNVTSQSWHQWAHIISIFLHIPRFLLIAPIDIGLATLKIAWFQQSFAYEVINWWSTFRRCSKSCTMVLSPPNYPRIKLFGITFSISSLFQMDS